MIAHYILTETLTYSVPETKKVDRNVNVLRAKPVRYSSTHILRSRPTIVHCQQLEQNKRHGTASKNSSQHGTTKCTKKSETPTKTCRTSELTPCIHWIIHAAGELAPRWNNVRNFWCFLSERFVGWMKTFIKNRCLALPNMVPNFVYVNVFVCVHQNVNVFVFIHK